MNKTGKKSWIAYLYILPMIVLSFVLVYYCIIDTVVVSFTDWDGMTDVFHFVALKNYIKMFKDHVFWTSVVNNLISLWERFLFRHFWDLCLRFF
jgi:raffinose/stachyose/melibiose transport system permease protein